MSEEERQVLYDDYFSESGDPGVDAVIEHRGKQLHFKLRKSVTLGEKQAALSASMSMSLTRDGTPVIERMDNAAYTEAIVLAAVKSWPFAFKDGSPVPITAESVHKLDGSLAEKISNRVLGQEAAQKEALAPFEMKFGAAS